MAAKDPAWAKKNVTLKSIEESVGAARFRPHYRMASHGVHANPKGVTQMPDWLPSERGLVLLTGPSPAGLADPGHGALLALTSVMQAVLAWRPGEASTMLARTLDILTADAGQAYKQAHDALEADDSGPTRPPQTRTAITRSFVRLSAAAQAGARRIARRH